MTQLETKFLPVNLAAETGAEVPEGTISGYGSHFGVKDKGGDIVEPGAFAESIAARRPLMCDGHDLNAIVGVWDEVVEDAKGLRVRGRLALGTQRGRDLYELLKMGAFDGLSIGYGVSKVGYRDGARLLQKINLLEISLVSCPMLPSARIDAVKAAEELTERELEKRLVRDAGLSRSVARSLMSGGFKSIRAERDAGQEQDLSELRALLNARASLSSTR